MTGQNLDSRCKALTKDGKPCRAAATAGGLCFFHGNPNKASELGRIGGRSKSPTVSENAEPLPVLDSATAVREAVDRLIGDLYAGKLHPKIAAGLAPLLQLQLRALGETEMERRLSRLERLVAKRERKSKSDGSTHQPKIGYVTTAEEPEAASQSEKDSGTPFTRIAEHVATTTGNNGHNHRPHSQASGAESKLDTMAVEQQGSDSRGGPRLQDGAARALQAELDEKERGESRVLVRVQDAAARALEQNNSEAPQAPSSPAAEETRPKRAEDYENETEPILPTGLQEAPSASGETGATTSATTTTTPETPEELMKRVQEEWMAGKFGWLGHNQK